MTQSHTRAFLSLIFALALALGGALMFVPAEGASATEHECGTTQHPSGNDRCEEPGGSGDQGNAQHDPDDNDRGPERSNGGVDQDDVDEGETQSTNPPSNPQDRDANNGCGNDQDFEDDNEGLCGGGERSGDNGNGGNRPATTDDDDDDDDGVNNAGGKKPTTSDDDDDDDDNSPGGNQVTTSDGDDGTDDDAQRPATPAAPGRDAAPGQQRDDDAGSDGEAESSLGTNDAVVAGEAPPAGDVGVGFGSQTQAQTPTVDDESAVSMTAAVPAEAEGSAEVVEQAEGELPATGANLAGGLLTAFGFYGLGVMALRRGRDEQEEPWLRG